MDTLVALHRRAVPFCLSCIAMSRASMPTRSIMLALVGISIVVSLVAAASASVVTADKSSRGADDVDHIVFGAVQYAPPALHSTVFSSASTAGNTRSTRAAAPSPAIDFIVANLRAYLAFVAEAAAAGVDVLVFPEGTLGWIAAESRDALVPYCAQLPAARPSAQPIPMCDATDAELKLRFAASASVLIDDIASAAPAVNTTQWAVQQLACAARYHGVTLVVNVCDIQPCATPASASTSSSVSAPSSSASAIPPPPSPPCQADGVYLFNTLLVLDATGAAVTKYYKSHLFTEARMFDAVPRAQRDLDTAWFDFAPNTVARSVSEPSTGAKRSADDGADGVAARARSTAARIGLFTCFDIEFAYPALPLMRTRGVTHLVLSSWWVNTLPLFHAAAIQQAFSRIAGDLAMHSADYGRDINVLSALSPALTSHRQSTFGRIGGQDGIESPSSTALADITLIAANSGRAQAAGGGVWSGGRPLVWLFDPSNDNVSQVLVAAVPVASAPAAAPLPAFQYRQGEVTRELDAKADTSFDCQFWLWHGRCVTLLDLPPSHASAADDDTSQSSAHATEPVDTTGTVTHGNFTCNIDAQLASISNFGAGAATTGANGPHSTSDRTRASSYLYVAFAFAGDLVFPKTPDSLRLRICAALVCAQTQTSRAGSMMPVQCASVTAAPAVVHAFRASAVFAPSVVVLPMLLTGPDAQVLPDPAASTALFSNATAAGTRASTGSGLTAGDASDSTDPIWRSFESRSEAGAFQPVPLLSLSMYGIDQAVD